MCDKTNIFIEKANKIHNNVYNYSKVKYVNALNEVTIICKEHGLFKQTPHKHLCGHGCPKCGTKYNKSELKILNILTREFKNVVYQKRLSTLTNDNNKFILDFYLPDYNTAIEYHGRQHFEAVSIFGGYEELINTQKRDIEKYNICLKEKIKLLYLSTKKYKNFNYHDKIYDNIYEIIEIIKK